MIRNVILYLRASLLSWHGPSDSIVTEIDSNLENCALAADLRQIICL